MDGEWESWKRHSGRVTEWVTWLCHSQWSPYLPVPQFSRRCVVFAPCFKCIHSSLNCNVSLKLGTTFQLKCHMQLSSQPSCAGVADPESEGSGGHPHLCPPENPLKHPPTTCSLGVFWKRSTLRCAHRGASEPGCFR